MPDFTPYTFELAAARHQTQELETLLASSDDLSESTFHEFFKDREHLRALVGHYNTSFLAPDRLAWQYPIFGDFRCDFAIGDWNRKAYTFVEFEDAGPNSLFVKQGEKVTRAWSRHFDAGYSQIIDWFCKLQAMTDTPDMEARLGKRAIRYAGVLLIGRDKYLQPGERLRLEWRRDHVVVNSKQIVCVTYDQLLVDLLFRIEQFASGGKSCN